MKFSVASWASYALLSSNLFALPTLAHPEPVQTKGLARREEVDRSKHIDNCIDYDVNLKDEDVGKFICNDQRNAENPEPVDCNKCLGLDGNKPTKSEKYLFCAFVTKPGGGAINAYVNRTACPGDDVPETDPDGNPSSDIAEGIVDAWCAVAGSGGFFGWVNMAACYSWVFATGEGSDLEEAKAGVDLTLAQLKADEGNGDFSGRSLRKAYELVAEEEHWHNVGTLTVASAKKVGDCDKPIRSTIAQTSQ